ncbi:hypothetical protein LQV63_10255 [Paenibacillus profundus]|uniref:Transposon Tn7 transposition protein TnsD C-termianl domain-containing protein n=1 Tax=Paenibacillus profundus TaxID=1173085 RepID=A0ABS8YH51_9BACL|nr:hypothetical protein [Paenibacillus profundus]MCE5169695.1 hypothetical protein [Paenibacillus profundus]
MTSKITLLHDKPLDINFYTWNLQWVKDYESPWSIFEKFKYANNIGTKDFLKTFGTDELLAIKHLALSEKNCNVVRMERLQDDKIEQILKVPVKKNAYNILALVNRCFPSINLLRSNLAYCKICIRKGYHSIYHQLTFIHNCPFHPRAKLYEACQICNGRFRYVLNDKFNPYSCECGAKIFNASYPFQLVWKIHKPKIVSPTLLKLLSLTEDEIFRLKEMHFIHNENVASYEKFLEICLNQIDKSFTIDTHINHRITVSHSNLFLHGNRKEEYSRAEKVADVRSMKIIDREIDADIYNSTVNTYNALCSRLRKTILKDHSSCIKKLFKQKEICPYAYAYINWRVCIEGLSNHSNILKVYNRKKSFHDYARLETISVEDIPIFQKLTHEWEKSLFFHEKNKRYLSTTATKWVTNHLLYWLLFNHFMNWLDFASKKRYREKGKVYFYFKIPFGYNNLPLFGFFQSGENIEFHVWENKWIRKQSPCICPFEKKRKKANAKTV